ncbi:MAG: hypothetical protein PHD21_03695 [Flavobacteriales bacterium]|nr:hypothetical protein [Flavobacteriales bacterium]
MTNLKDSQEQMFIYHQTILEKVSFSPELFSHELTKALQDLSAEQGEELLLWIKMRFGYQSLPCRVSY